MSKCLIGLRHTLYLPQVFCQSLRINATIVEVQTSLSVEFMIEIKSFS